MPINFRFFRGASTPPRPPGESSRTPATNGGPSKAPDKAPKLPPLNFDSSNPHGLQRSDGGRRASIDRTDPEMAHFWNNHEHPVAFDNKAPVTDPMEALYWKTKNNEMGRIWGKEENAVVPKRPSAMEVHRIMQSGPENHSPLLESTVKSLPEASREFFNNAHNWTADSLRIEMTPKQPESFGNFRFGGGAPNPPMLRPTSEASMHDAPKPIAPEIPQRSQEPSKGFNTIIIPDLLP